MATTYTLRFPRFKLIDHEGMTDVIRRMEYALVAVTDDPTPVEVSISGSVVLEYPDPGSFIPRPSVTPSNAHTWFAALDDEEGNNLLTGLKARLDSKIAAKQAVRNDKPDVSFRETGVSV